MAMKAEVVRSKTGCYGGWFMVGSSPGGWRGQDNARACRDSSLSLKPISQPRTFFPPSRLLSSPGRLACSTALRVSDRFSLSFTSLPSSSCVLAATRNTSFMPKCAHRLGQTAQCMDASQGWTLTLLGIHASSPQPKTCYAHHDALELSQPLPLRDHPPFLSFRFVRHEIVCLS